MSKVGLITGMGMDSKTLAHILLSKNYHVILTYRRNTSKDLKEITSLFADDLKKYPNSKLDVEFCDITDFSSVKNCILNVLKLVGKIDELYSLAAQSHVGDSFKNALYTLEATGMAIYYILETLREYSPKTKIYQASTSEMFGGDPSRNPFNEKSPFELRSPYSISKNLAYNWCQYYRQTYELFISSGILFNHSNHYRNLTFFCRHVTNSAAKIALGKIKEFSVGNIHHYRDEHFSDFGCEAMYKMLQLKDPVDLVIGTGEAQYGEDYLNLAFNYFNLDWRQYVKFDANKIRPNEVIKLTADSGKAQKLIGWNPNRMLFKNHIEIMCKWDFELESGEQPKRQDVLALYP